MSFANETNAGANVTLPQFSRALNNSNLTETIESFNAIRMPAFEVVIPSLGEDSLATESPISDALAPMS